LFSIPILLSFDNFVAGLLEGSSHAAQFVVLAGLASGLAAWMGLSIGQLAARRLSQTRAVVTGLSLIALAFSLLN
jgi:putative Mn2+ efflux pump MntP